MMIPTRFRKSIADTDVVTSTYQLKRYHEMYRITMTRTTSGEVVVEREISGYTRAYSTFVEMCDERSYNIQENPMEGTYFGGGHGYDYFIELSLIDPDDIGEQTQYEPF